MEVRGSKGGEEGPPPPLLPSTSTTAWLVASRQNGKCHVASQPATIQLFSTSALWDQTGSSAASSSPKNQSAASCLCSGGIQAGSGGSAHSTSSTQQLQSSAVKESENKNAGNVRERQRLQTGS